MDHGVLRHYAVLCRIGLDDLELNRTTCATSDKGIALAYWAVGLEEVRLEEDLEDVASQACESAWKRL